jgi:hypothetical protein
MKPAMLTNEYKRASCLCEWFAWRSVGSRSGHTVGGMCMQPAGVATKDHLSLSDRHAGVCKRERSLDGRSAAAVKELGMTLGGEPEQDRR